MHFIGGVLIFVALILGVLGAIIVAILKILRSPKGRATDAGDPEETRLIQELYQGLERMEQRIEALETILLEREQRSKEQ